jgi:Mce-associated membrane protein
MTTFTTHAGRAVTATERDPAPEPSTDTNPRTGPKALNLTPRHVWLLAAVVLVAAVVLAATSGREWYAARQTDQAHAAATAAARQLAINFVTVDYQKVDADTARVRTGATGEFLKSYSASVEELKKVLVANQTVSTVQRSEAALVSGDRDSAVALVGVVAPTKNTAVPAGETKTYRMRLDLRKVGDTWKVENLEFVG